MNRDVYGDKEGLAVLFGTQTAEKRPPPLAVPEPHNHKRIKLDVSSRSRATEKLKKVIQEAFLRRSVKLSLKPYNGPAHRPHDGYFYWRGMPPVEQPPQFKYDPSRPQQSEEVLGYDYGYRLRVCAPREATRE